MPDAHWHELQDALSELSVIGERNGIRSAERAMTSQIDTWLMGVVPREFLSSLVRTKGLFYLLKVRSPLPEMRKVVYLRRFDEEQLQ